MEALSAQDQTGHAKEHDASFHNQTLNSELFASKRPTLNSGRAGFQSIPISKTPIPPLQSWTLKLFRVTV
jgi:hypothetical protein